MISLRNNAQSVLTLPVSAEQTLLNLSLGDGGKFPDLSLGDSFRCASCARRMYRRSSAWCTTGLKSILS